MKILLLTLLIPLGVTLLIPLGGFAQYESNKKIPFRATVITDTGTIQGYFVDNNDSSVILSPQKRYIANTTINIPVNTIQEMRLKNKKNRLGYAAGGAVFGFLLTAGLIQNNDYDNNGKTSFWELIWSAIEGSTSKNRQRRVASLIAGTAGGTTLMLVVLFAGKNLSIVFPLHNRNDFYNKKRYKINEFIAF